MMALGACVTCRQPDSGRPDRGIHRTRRITDSVVRGLGEAIAAQRGNRSAHHHAASVQFDVEARGCVRKEN